ncbi:MAG: cytochrome c biogenesis protein CcsA [Candidatus Scalindua sp.]|nr:cytochrome c biogenesis protein CcsA [Candidatus Scalindua sp.]
MNPQFLIKLSVIFFWCSLFIDTSYWIIGFLGRKVRFYVLLSGVVLHISAITFRGLAIEYFPLTNKFESFSGFALATFIVLLCNSKIESYVYRISLFCVGYCFLVAASFFPKNLTYAPPLMLTIWYILHVPISFFCYALWTSSSAAALAKYFSAGNQRRFEQIIDFGFQYGFIAFSISMIFGGLWGFVAWGSYFMWDPKVLWSVIIWFFYATCIHLDYWTEAKKFKTPLALVGFVILLTTYVGTSFFTQSSHRF